MLALAGAVLHDSAPSDGCTAHESCPVFPAASSALKGTIAITLPRCPFPLPFLNMPRPLHQESSVPTKGGNAIVDRPSGKYESMQLGAYRLTFGEKRGPNLSLPGKEQAARVQDFASMLPFARRFLVEVCKLGPCQLAAIWVIELLQSVQPGVNLYLSNWLLRTVSSDCYIPLETKFGYIKLDRAWCDIRSYECQSRSQCPRCAWPSHGRHLPPEPHAVSPYPDSVRPPIT